MNPFDYLNSINYSKKDLMTDDITESNYNSYIITIHLSKEENLKIYYLK